VPSFLSGPGGAPQRIAVGLGQVGQVQPEDLGEYAPITTDQKKKILGLNAAKMYDIPVPADLQLPAADETAVGPRGADNLVDA